MGPGRVFDLRVSVSSPQNHHISSPLFLILADRPIDRAGFALTVLAQRFLRANCRPDDLLSARRCVGAEDRFHKCLVWQPAEI
jgi:hypothetical protein